MGLAHSPSLVTDGLVLCLDAGNPKSYPGSGTAWIDLSNNNNGTLTNGPSLSSSNGGIFVFDGTNDTVVFPFNLTYLPAMSNFSMEMCMKIESFPPALANPNVHGFKRTAGLLFGAAYYAGTALDWVGDENGQSLNVRAWIRGTDAHRPTTSYSVPLNSWTHLVLVNNYSSSLLQFYVNGVLYTQRIGPTAEYNTSFVTTAGNIGLLKPQVAAGGTLNYTYLGCSISLARIYKNKALTASEVAQNFAATRGRFGL